MCGAAERLERGIVERLDAERDAVDAGGAVAAKARGFDAGRVGFQRHLDIGRDAPGLRDGIEDRADGCGCISDGVPPPKKIVETVRPWYALRGRGDFGRKGAHEARFVDAAVADMAVEVAIGTFRQTERPMDVDGERRAVVKVMLSIIAASTFTGCLRRCSRKTDYNCNDQVASSAGTPPA